MLVQTFSGFILIVLCGVDAFKPSRTSQTQGNANSYSGSWSSAGHSSASSSSYSSSKATTPENYFRCNDRNATLKECPNPCPGTCAFPGRVPCNKACVKIGCECKEGFYLNDKGKCVQLQDCPGAKTCSSNETFAFCKAGCPTNNCPVNDNRGIIACSPPFPCGSGCLCKNNYLRNTEGLCILYSDCPPINCTRQNEVYSARPPPCILESCTDLWKPSECTRTYPSRPQCVCRAGYYRNKDDICVPQEQCDYLLCNDRNATFKECPNPCPGTCAFPGRVPCERACVESGCECKEGFFLNDEGKCVQLQDCPGAKTCSSNETFAFCKAGCPNNNCPVNDNRGIIACSPPFPCGSGCLCKNDYLRNTEGLCILYSDCPAINCTRQNEVYSARPPPCIFESCTDIGNSKECTRTYPSRPQCVCRAGYYRNKDYICVPQDQCAPPIPNCKENEVPSPCKIVCPPQSCASLYTLYSCIQNIPCEPGCDCKKGYLRDANGKCIPSEKCPKNPPCGYNEVFSKCKITCPPQTCNSTFTSYLCSNETVCEAGCDCRDGYLRNESNICVPSEECFPDPGCNGDPNAEETACPWPFPSTCDSPKAGLNGKMCDKIGCQCKPGFMLSNFSGKCILPDDCESGNPCGANGTFSECAFPCPNQYCPEDDSQLKVACKPGRPCPSGCRCKPYYLMKSYDDETCVLASDCNPVTCTRPNEVWNQCASECLAESCNDLITKPECYPDPENCQPQCVCREGFYRNTSGVCVPKADCPITCEVQQECRPTCAVPNPPNCPYIPPSNTNVDSCHCQSGFVLSTAGGKCIKIEECAANETCNGDSNATIKECPLPCPSTCESPNAMPCKRMCDPIGCECKPGYLKSDTGKCILPDECKGGNPCGQNENFVPCRYECSTNYCPKNDNRSLIVCETYPCFSGCSCRLNHKRLSTEDPRCIVSSECPPVECTRQHEIWNPCPSACNSEYCDAVDSPAVTCNTLVLNCDPKCECRKTYFRNGTGICVSSKECRRLNNQKQCS